MSTSESAIVGGSSKQHRARSSRRRVLVACSIGNFIEWYDFVIYGALATTIAAVFFPTENEVTGLLAAFATFGVAFVMRPVGGLLFGHIGDRLSRRSTLVLVVGMTSGATFCIGLLPPFASAGVMAPLLLVVLRCLQGLGAGAEMSGASAFMLEHAPEHRRGLYAGMVGATAVLGLAGGVFAALLLSAALPAGDVQSWGWRLPFLAAGPLGLIALYIRRKLEETPSFRTVQETRQPERIPLVTLLQAHRRQLAVVFALVLAHAVGIYFLGTFLVGFLVRTHNLDQSVVLMGNLGVLVLVFVLSGLFGWLSDHVGRRRVAIAGLLGYTVLAVPVYLLTSAGGPAGPLVGQLLLGLAAALTTPMVTVIQVEMFPAAVRFSGAALSYNTAQVLGGGATPFVATWLAASFGTMSPFLYVGIVACAALLVVAALLPETAWFGLASLDRGGATKRADLQAPENSEET